MNCIARREWVGRAYTNVGRVSVALPGKNTLDLTSAAFAAVVLDGRGQVILGVFSAITGVVIVQRFDAEFIGVEQVFEQLLHRHFSGREARRIVVSVGRDRLVDKLLHDTHQLQITVVVRHLPQQLVGVLQVFVIRHHLAQDTVLGRFDTHVAARRLNAVGGVGDLRRGLGRHQRGERGVAQAVGFNGFAQCFPVVVQGFADDAVQIFLIGIDRQDALRIGGFVEPRAGALLDSQLVRGLQQIVLNRFERFVRQVVGAAVGVAFAMLRQIVSEVDHADTQRTTPPSHRV